jgi:adenylate cyclase
MAPSEKQNEVTVMFADVSGSTRLYDLAGDAVAHAAIDKCVSFFKRKTAEGEGRVIKTIGDEVMAAFPSASQAAQAAIAMQAGLAEMPAPFKGVQLGARIGFHCGPVVERDGDLFGDTVNLAARLTELASKGQIITTHETVELLAPILKMDCRKLHSLQVKGKSQEIGICELLWQDTDDATTMMTDRPPAATIQSALRLTYHEKQIHLPKDRNSVVMGRDAAADLVIQDRMASRIHCEIEQRLDKFVLMDRSANGTYVAADGQREIVLRREELILRGQGRIAFGQSPAATAEFVEFFSE